jgi:hypothetical protein
MGVLPDGSEDAIEWKQSRHTQHPDKSGKPTEASVNMADLQVNNRTENILNTR